MDTQEVRDSAFESVDAEDYGANSATNEGDTSLDMLEQQQAKEQARLLNRFRELRQWQQKQQEQLMQQQQLQLEMLKGEQLRVQSLLASQRGAQWGDGRVSRPEASHKSPPLMTPPRRSGLGQELVKTMMSSMQPFASNDSGLVASMGDTLEPPKGSVPVPVMPVSPSLDEDKYTNPELFSNPGSLGDDLQAVDDRVQFNDGGSEVSSDNFYLPPLPPEPKEAQGNLGASLSTLQALMRTSAPNLLQQMLGQLPPQQRLLLLEQRQAAVQESASPTFSPIEPHSLPHHSLPAASSSATTVPALSASVPEFVPSEAMFMPRSFAALYDQSGVGMEPQRLQAPIQRPQAPLQRPQGPVERPQAQNQRPQVPFQGAQALLQRPQGPVQGPHAQFHGPPQVQGFPAQASFPSSQGQRSVPHFQTSVPTSIPPHHYPVPSDSPPLQSMEQRRQQQQHQQQAAAYPVPHPGHKWPERTAVVPLEPQVKSRDSWEEGREGGRDSVGEELRPGGEFEEEEEEELNTTVKAAVRDPEEQPITTGLQGRKTFEQLLEEQLAEERQQMEAEQKRVEQRKSSAVKRPFLRKGQGIARFSHPIKRPPPRRPSSQKPEAPRSSLGASSHRSEAVSGSSVGARAGSTGLGSSADRSAAPGRASVSSRRAPEKKRVSGGRRQQEDKDPPQPEKLTLIKRKQETGKKAQGALRHQTMGDHSQGTLSHRTEGEDLDEKDSIADDASFVAGMKEREKKAPLEAEELDEFEALEDIADNMSLVSNSSVVQRLITPNKQRQKAAVSDLKTVLENKKRAAQSSPFERNAAIRSLLSIAVPGPPFSQPPDPQQRPEDNDDTLTEEDSSSGGETEACKVITARYRDNADNEHTELKGKTSDGDVNSAFTESGFNFKQGQTLNGLDFSKQFSLFGQQGQSSYSNEDKGSVSPQKSLTRKVATLQSRLNSANDTASLLQKLSAQAGFLSSGFSQMERAETVPKTVCAEGDESLNDNSLLSSSVSQPHPVVIGGKKADQFKPEVNSGNDVKDDESDEDDSSSTVERNNNHRLSSGEEEEEEVPFGGKVSAAVVDGAEAAPNSNSNNVNVNNDEDPGDDWEDEEEWTSTAPRAAENQAAPQPGVKGETTPPTSKLMSRLFPKLKPQPSALQQQQQQKMQMAASTNIGDGIQSKVLREKLAELEAEIEKFRTENASLERLRREREDGVNRLKEEIARFDREKTTELQRLQEFKAQEMKKLKHERKLFETYQKQVRSMPDKKEREEMEALKRQLTDLQDEMKRKENRWASSTTRLKTRLVELEAENTEMREEMKTLERKRLEWMQTRPANQSSLSQSAAARKSTPRSSTPTNDSAATSNGILDNPARSRPSGAQSAALSGAVAMATQMNGVGAAGKSGAGVGGHNNSGGESMPRGEPATPSMIEGVSPAVLSSNVKVGEADGSFLAPKPASSFSSSSSSRMVDRPSIDRGNGQFEETQYSDGKVERVYANGSREVLFANGTRKEISPDGQYFIVSFFNGDIKQVFPDQRVVYYYAESQTTHTTYPDRLEVLQFPNNQTEKHYPDGTHEILFPNQTVKYLFPNGTEESIFPDGTILRIDKNGEKVLEFPNGQREIHTQQHKRREYPDGTVKTLHNDGRQETRYATGRVRLKDKDGNVILDEMR